MTAEVPDASQVSYQGIIQPALNACSIAMKQGGGTYSNQNGSRWAWGGVAQTLFNTVAPPNSMPWNSCSDQCSGCGANDTEFSNAQSNHPGGVNVLMADGSAVHQELDQPADVDATGDAGQRRGDQLRRVLNDRGTAWSP